MNIFKNDEDTRFKQVTDCLKIYTLVSKLEQTHAWIKGNFSKIKKQKLCIRINAMRRLEKINSDQTYK